MREIASHLTNVAREDCSDNGNTTTQQRFTGSISVSLEDLIEPSAQYWQELHKKSTARSLNEELEFSEGETDISGDSGAHA